MEETEDYDTKIDVMIETEEDQGRREHNVTHNSEITTLLYSLNFKYIATMDKDKAIIIWPVVHNKTYLQWDIRTSTFDFDVFEETYQVKNFFGKFEVNKSNDILALWNRGLKIYSAQTGIRISSYNEHYKNQDNENFHINIFRPDKPLKVDLINKISTKYVGFNAQTIYKNKIIGIVKNKVQILDFVEYLQSDCRDQYSHFFSNMDEILEKLINSENYISTDLKKELKGHQISWNYDKDSGKLSANKKGDIFQSFFNSDIKICIDKLILLSNDDLMIFMDSPRCIIVTPSESYTLYYGKLQIRFIFYDIDFVKMYQKNIISEYDFFVKYFYDVLSHLDKQKFFIDDESDFNKWSSNKHFGKKYSSIGINGRDHLFLLHGQALLSAAIKGHKMVFDKFITLVVPLPKFSAYESKYSFWKEILGKPSSNGFVKMQIIELYSDWNGLISTSGQKFCLWLSSIIGCLLLQIYGNLYGIGSNIYSPWNLFDICALLFPVSTSIYWLSNGTPPLWAPALSCLFLYFKFLFFLRAFERFNVGFILQLWLALLSSENSSTTDVNSNLYSYFETSLLAVYLLMTGDNSSLSTWDYRENPILVILMVLFLIFTVLFMLNLFIGLLSNAIQDHDNRAAFLLQKAK
ncbi:12407_t:CDS:2, partial [Dentiscutata heterogama]